MSSKWQLRLTEVGPMFHDVQALFASRLPRDWPTARSLNTLLPFNARSLAGLRLRFQEQSAALNAVDYERSIFDCGTIPTRAGSWHDLFNALAWAAFPHSKATINAGHVRDRFAPARSRRRDALTLLDECGVVIATSEPDFEYLNRHHRWHALFWERRSAWWRTTRPFLFGHGLLEQCMDPYLGLTGKALYVPVPPGFHALPLNRQHALIDHRLAAAIPTLDSPRHLLPFPVLGVPRWDPRNEQASFYDNKEYFRPKRKTV